MRYLVQAKGVSRGIKRWNIRKGGPILIGFGFLNLTKIWIFTEAHINDFTVLSFHFPTLFSSYFIYPNSI